MSYKNFTRIGSINKHLPPKTKLKSSQDIDQIKNTSQNKKSIPELTKFFSYHP